MNPSADLPQTTDEAAAAWVIRQEQGPLSPAEQRALEAWLARNDAHRAAYAFAQGAWKQLDRLRDEPGRFASDFAAMMPVQTASRRNSRLAGGIAALAASIVIAVTGATIWFGNPLTRLQADFATAPAEIASVVLADGSRVDLAPDSAITLDFTENERHVTLLAGSAYFTVASQAVAGNRPFVVRAGDGAGMGSIRALGTQFAVERAADTINVIVTEHSVEVVAPLKGRDSRATVIGEGQGITYDAGGLQLPRGVKAEQATVWHRRRLVFDRQTVAEVAAELSRYRRGQILVRSPALAQKQFSGVLDIGDVDGALRIVAEELKAEVTLLPFVAVLQ